MLTPLRIQGLLSNNRERKPGTVNKKTDLQGWVNLSNAATQFLVSPSLCPSEGDCAKIGQLLTHSSQ